MFTVNDFIAQMNQVKKLGSLRKIMDSIPGMRERNVNPDEVEHQMIQMQAICNSMNKIERVDPIPLGESHQRRIAQGAGVSLNDVGQFIKQFEMSRKMMKRVDDMRGGASRD
jgi:signal recognition particle subunit SRP54